jgi:predicted nucleotidyltransferase
MSSHLLDERTIGALVECLKTHPTVAAAYVLGSAATGRLRPDSDIDIAVLPASPGAITVPERLTMMAALSDAAGRVVDVGLLSTASLVYAKEAVAHGILVFERDPALTGRFAMYALSMYATLQEARREVLSAYAA